MPYAFSLQDINLSRRDQCGDKAAFLGELMHAGFDVPPGLCIPADTYREILAAERVTEKIVARIEHTEIDDPIELEAAADEIRAWIDTAQLPPGLGQEMEAALASLGKSYAVRASRVIEDVPNPAASGAQQAYLGIVGSDAVLQKMKQCWAAPWNSRAIYYRHQKKIDHRRVAMAVIVQPMLNADAAGVMFTANPLTGASDEIHIDATWGLGEAIIAARWKPDHFVVGKSNFEIRERALAIKCVMDIVAPEGDMQTVAVPPGKQDAASLSDPLVVALATVGQRVETLFKAAQDIEWCCIGDKIYLLQTRPLNMK
jgi:phosphoenolpyruvate synthase/pyruvate phosphate dikinase